MMFHAMRNKSAFPRLTTAGAAASLLAVSALVNPVFYSSAQEIAPQAAPEPAPEAIEPGANPQPGEEDVGAGIRTAAPDTNDCPHAERPAEPVTTSERLAPGETSPTPPPPVEGDDCGVTAPRGFDVDDAVVASAWMVSDIDTGEIIAQKDPNGRYRPASIIKVLLALEVLGNLDLDKKVIASDESASIDGSAVGIGAGGEYTVRDLLNGLLMVSGNDAAHALAEELGGEEETLRRINERARDLGADSTYAASYSGLDAAGMQTTAHDLSLMYRAAYNNPTFAEIVNTVSTEFPGYDDHPSYEMGNDNGLFLNDDDGIGGKTGYTDDAHHTFVGAVDHDGRRLMAVILDTTIEHGPRAWEQAQMLLHEAYDVQPGEGIGTLEEESTETTEETPSPAPQGETDTIEETSGLAQYGPWIGGAAIAVIAFAAIVAAALLPRRSRGRHAHR